MADQHGKSTVVLVNGNALTTFINTSTLKRGAMKHAMSTYGTNSEKNRSGLGTGDFTMGGWYDTSLTAGPRAILEPLVGGENVTIIYRPEGTGTGKPQASFAATVDEYVQTAPANDYVTWTASFTKSGDITDSIQA